jgi:putative Holliday junction resolvase
MTSSGYILALDVGEKRIGIAIASPIARLAKPLQVIQNTEKVWLELSELIQQESIDVVVVGLPRSLEGNDTAQTTYARDFAKRLAQNPDIQVVLQDEALTSHQAEAELRSSRRTYEKGDIDALAATYILEDYLVTMNAMEGGSA